MHPTEPAEPRTVKPLRFGDRPSDVIHPDVAEQVLIEFKRTNPKLFGRLLAAAMVPESVSPSRRGKHGQVDEHGQADEPEGTEQP